MDAPQSLLIQGFADNIRVPLFPSCGLTSRTGTWEIAIKSIFFLHIPDPDREKLVISAYSVECNLVKQIQLSDKQEILKAAVLELFQKKKNVIVTLHHPPSLVWYEVNNKASYVQFVLRNVETNEEVLDKDKVILHILYRRKR